MKKRPHERKPDLPDMEETKDHILAAGREIMLAAQGALRFCKVYAAESASPSTKYQLMSFFGKAIAVADELGRGLVSASSISRSAKKIAKPFMDAIGTEMKECVVEKQPARGAVKPKPRHKRPARRSKARSRRKA